MNTKVRVYGKSQSRTALGIINAYLKLYPDSTLADLQQAFPKSLNPKSFADNIIVPAKETKGHEKMFFEREDELIVLRKGKKLALVEVWTKEDFDAIREHAKQYGIEVAEMEGTKAFEKGSFELEYLDGFIPPDEGGNECGFCWWWIVLLALLLLVLLFFLTKCNKGKKELNRNPAPVENVAAPVETTPAPATVNADSLSASIALPDGIEKGTPEFKLFSFLNSNDAKVDASAENGWITLDKLRFAKGATTLLPGADEQLKNLAEVMKKFPNSRIEMGGYTDNRGTDALNMRLSTERAKVAAAKLISLGVEANRVTSQGYGSQRPLCPANDTEECRAMNRRIDVKVTQK